MKRLLFILFALISLNLYAQLPSTPPISLQDIRDERGGTGSTSLQTEAALWYTQTGQAKFNFPVNGSISIQDWLGEIWDLPIETYITQSPSPSITIQRALNGGRVKVYWGDGTENNYPSGLFVVTHNYSVQAVHNIVIESEFSLLELTIQEQSLTHVDVSQNPNLVTLTLIGNSLTSLNISNNTLLEGLLVGHNQLTSIIPPASINNMTFLNVINNKLPVSAINQLLILADNSTAALPNLFSSNSQTPSAPPSGAGITAKNSLIAKGWSVSTD